MRITAPERQPEAPARLSSRLAAADENGTDPTEAMGAAYSILALAFGSALFCACGMTVMAHYARFEHAGRAPRCPKPYESVRVAPGAPWLLRPVPRDQQQIVRARESNTGTEGAVYSY